MESTSDRNIINGIDVSALKACIDEVRDNPPAGSTFWRVQSRWIGGARTEHHVAGCTLGGKFIDRPFTIRVDEPLELCGSNLHANPQEYLLSAINACMMVGYAAVAALMGIRLSKLEVETTGDIDLRGFLGIRTDVPAGYVHLDQVVRIAGDASDDDFKRLHEVVRATSPNFYNITRAIPMYSRLVVEPQPTPADKAAA